MNVNVYDDAGILPMAIRMRRQRICPAEIDNMYGEIIKGIVKMATLLLPKEDPRYTMHLQEFMSEDVQSLMIVNTIRSADTLVDTNSSSRNIVNYLTKAVQNRLRNYVRDTEKKKNLMLPLDSASDLFSTAIDGRRLPLVSWSKKKDRKAD
jgi:hypothetical protein